jgi:mono/diheme cytochrome c family protein
VRRLLVVIALLAVVGAAAFWFLTVPERVDAAALPAAPGDAARGQVMFHAADCGSCHATPGQDNPLLLGGGLGLPTPFGTFHVPNISPDPVAGIGRWSDADFATALVKGTAPDGRHYYPAFPYTSFQRMTLSDIKDLFAYLKTLPQSANVAPPHDLPFPFNIRRGVGLWKLAFLDGQPFRPDPAKDAVWNRGAYLVEGPAHCAECHSPRNMLGGIVADQRFAGGIDVESKGRVPNITPGEGGIGDWTEDDIFYALTDGVTPDGDTLGHSMASVVRNTAALPEGDRRAIARYIKSLPPHPTAH